MFSHSVLFKGSPDFELLTLSCKLPTNNPEFYLALFIDHPWPVQIFYYFDQAVELLESVEWENLLSNSDPSLY